MVLVFPRGAEPLFTVPEELGTYNGRYFRAANLKIEQKPFSQTSELVVVQGLAGAKAAQAYATKLRGPQSPLAKLRGAGYQTLVVSIDNLPLLLQRHDVDEYLRFYQQTYTK